MDEKQRKLMERGEKLQEFGKKMEKTGSGMQALGCLMTVLLTIPIALTIMLGPIGLGISVLIIIIFFAARKASKK